MPQCHSTKRYCGLNAFSRVPSESGWCCGHKGSNTPKHSPVGELASCQSCELLSSKDPSALQGIYPAALWEGAKMKEWRAHLEINTLWHVHPHSSKFYARDSGHVRRDIATPSGEEIPPTNCIAEATFQMSSEMKDFWSATWSDNKLTALQTLIRDTFIYPPPRMAMPLHAFCSSVNVVPGSHSFPCFLVSGRSTFFDLHHISLECQLYRQVCFPKNANIAQP